MDTKLQAERYKVWLKQAEYDLQAANLSFEHHFFEWATYQAEQAVEKALKAMLVHNGWKAPRIHKLQILIGMANQASPKFKQTKFDFKHLESFTFISRYPFLLPGFDQAPHDQITSADSSRALEQANGLLKIIDGILKQPAEAGKPEKDIEAVYSEDAVQSRIQQIKEILVREFDPEKLILFGSYARKDYVPSTIDIMVIAETKLPFIERIIAARTATKGSLPVIEPLVYTPKEFEIMTEGGDSFMENVLHEGRVIYEKKNQ